GEGLGQSGTVLLGDVGRQGEEDQQAGHGLDPYGHKKTGNGRPRGFFLPLPRAVPPHHAACSGPSQVRTPSCPTHGWSSAQRRHAAELLVNSTRFPLNQIAREETRERVHEPPSAPEPSYPLACRPPYGRRLGREHSSDCHR